MGFVRLILVGVFTGIYVRKLSILDKEIGIVFAHKFLDKNKKSEIKALKELLEDKRFSQEEQVFSFDALLTQFEILNTMDIKGNCCKSVR